MSISLLSLKFIVQIDKKSAFLVGKIYNCCFDTYELLRTIKEIIRIRMKQKLIYFEVKMNTAQDRANRIRSWSARSRDLLGL